MAKKVLKHGDPDKINGLKYFRCDYCDCVFEADKNDYWGGDQRDPGYYSSCPDCGAGCSETRKPKDASQLYQKSSLVRKVCSNMETDDPNCRQCFNPEYHSCFSDGGEYCT